MASFGFKIRRRTSFCVCVCFLVLVTVQQCGGTGEGSSALVQKDNGYLNYTSPNLNLNYNSSTTVNAKAMEQLYYVTNFFIQIIQKEDMYPEGLLEDENGKFTTDKLSQDWLQLIQHYAGVVAVTVIGVVFIVLMPLVALFFCCCRCAGRCGGRNQPFEKKRDPCRRITYGIILSGVAIIILFGVVCAFVTNEYMEDGIQTLPSKLDVALNDIHLYKENTLLELTTLLVDNFVQLAGSLSEDLNSASSQLLEQLKHNSTLNVLNRMNSFSDGLTEIQFDMGTIKTQTNALKNETEYVNNKLHDIKENLMLKLNDCLSVEACNKSLREVQETNNPADFSNLPDITDQLSHFDNIDDIQNGIKAGKDELEDIKKKINDTITSKAPEVLKQLDEAGDAVADQSKDIRTLMNNVTSTMDRDAKPVIRDMDTYISKYSEYRYYVDISVSAVMLLVLLSITLGLFYGFCGKRPDTGYDDDCCNKATGASFLMLAAYVMFFFSAVLMLITLAHFLLGILAQKGVCQSLQNPASSQLLALADTEVKFEYTVNKNTVTVNISSIISSCHANDSLYNILQLAKTINIEEILDYPETYQIKQKIEELKQGINISSDVTLIDQTTKDDLLEIAKTDLDLTTLNDVISSVNQSSGLMDLASSLNTTADNPQIADDIRDSLRSESEKLRELHEINIKRMLETAEELNTTAHALKEKLKFNSSSLSDAINGMITEVEEAQEYLKSTNSTRDIMGLIDQFANNTLDKVNKYLHLVVTRTTTQVGYCEPLSMVYNASLVATCNDIVDPFNGFWASIGWCLVLFIPAIILCVKLASLYRKSEPYHAAGIPDTEYLYDAYADRDNIPLANGPDKKNHHRRYNETYDNSSGYMGDYSSHIGRSAGDRRDRGGPAYHPDDARFNDMAPKHWDYANGAMPRYHSPPLSTEYERPPPYYYPGPGASEETTGTLKSADLKSEVSEPNSEKYHTYSGLPKLTTNVLRSAKDRVSTFPKTVIDSFKGLPRLNFGSLKRGQPQLPRHSEHC